jgi:hypothetical protein
LKKVEKIACQGSKQRPEAVSVDGFPHDPEKINLNVGLNYCGIPFELPILD